MVVLVTCKNEDPIKIKAIERSQHKSLIFGRSRAANSEISDEILTNFKLIQGFIIVLVTCKNKKDDSSKN